MFLPSRQKARIRPDMTGVCTCSSPAQYSKRWAFSVFGTRSIRLGLIHRPNRSLAAMTGRINPEEIDEDLFSSHLFTRGIPDPDLMIRTGGDRRISNFLMWQLAYAELWFSDALWPDFGNEQLEEAVNWFGGRERRFGMTSEQIA